MGVHTRQHLGAPEPLIECGTSPQINEAECVNRVERTVVVSVTGSLEDPDSCSNPFPNRLPLTLTCSAHVPGKEAVRGSRHHGPTSPSVLRDKVHEGVRIMKKILLLIATAAGVLAIQKKLKDQQAEQDLWAEATDEV